ncbi:hypothetical protein ONZ45_g5011 [Pleurotus djamor]|nr:hypothetical protein ONZ45_g5011 [Pleurotus djamor]
MAGQTNNNFGPGTFNVLNPGATQINNHIYSPGTAHIEAASARVTELKRTAAPRYQGIIDSMTGICQLMEELRSKYEHVLPPLFNDVTESVEAISYAVKFLTLVDEAPDLSRLRHFKQMHSFLSGYSLRLRQMSQDLLAYAECLRGIGYSGFWRGILLLIYAYFSGGTPAQDLQNCIANQKKQLDQLSHFLATKSWKPIIQGQLRARLETLVEESAIQLPSPLRYVQPLKLTVMNHLGDSLPIPLVFCSSLEDLKIVIKHWCRDRPGDSFIQSNSWELIHPKSNKSVQQSMFSRVAKPHSEFAISIFLEGQDLLPYYCPRPGCGKDNRHQTQYNGWVTCYECFLQFSISRTAILNIQNTRQGISQQSPQDEEPERHESTSQQIVENKDAPQESSELSLQNPLDEGGGEEHVDIDTPTPEEELQHQHAEPTHNGKSEEAQDPLSLFKRVTVTIQSTQTEAKQEQRRDDVDPQIRTSTNRKHLDEKAGDTRPHDHQKSARKLSTPLGWGGGGGKGMLNWKKIKVQDIKSDDKIIALMGPTGAGKSNFIGVALRDSTLLGIGHKLNSFTDDVSATRYTRGKDSVVLVDTPGFDDTTRSDTDILKLIASWLEKTYKKGHRLAGILYLHRISDNRMAGSPLRNLHLFQSLCGVDPLKRVIFVTTMWTPQLKMDLATARETELKVKFWKSMLENGSRTERFQGDFASAWEILDSLLHAEARPVPVLLQEELVDLRKRLRETAAGRTLYADLVRLLDEQKATVEKLRNEAANSGASQNPRLRQELGKQLNQVDLLLHSTIKQVDEMKIPLMARVRGTLFGKRATTRSLGPD